MASHPIELSSKTLVHISSGIYRSTASALKELVSNAFDADASIVRINTNFPQFDVITCSDDGSGMTRDEFISLMQGIGNSRKRVGDKEARFYTPGKRRPIIGRIGIGMLAIAQVCYEFKVISHHRDSQTAFEAVLSLNPPRRRAVTGEGLQRKYRIGTYTCERIDYDPKKAGLHIVTKDVLDTYTRRYREDVARGHASNAGVSSAASAKKNELGPFVPVPMRFEDMWKKFATTRSIRELGEYWRLFWELAIACPVRYLDDAPIRDAVYPTARKAESRTKASEAIEIITRVRDQQSAFKFDVVLDNVVLRKPARIPPKVSQRGEARLTPIAYDEVIRGDRLRFHGYIYSQNRAIYPAELRGLLIRVRNVAIGEYDPAFLKYEIVEGFRFDWLSGEIYVEEGLEDALNIDRNSFNEVHPHYLALQKEVHRTLRDIVFPETRRAAEQGRHRKTRTTAADNDRSILQTLTQFTGNSYSIVRSNDEGTDGPISFDSSTGRITVYEHPIWPQRRTERSTAEKILITHCIAQEQSGGTKEQAETFFRLLQGVFGA